MQVPLSMWLLCMVVLYSRQDLQFVPGPSGRQGVITTHDIAATWQLCHLRGCFPFPSNFPPDCLLLQPGFPSRQRNLSA